MSADPTIRKLRHASSVRWLRILVVVAMFSGFFNLIPAPLAPATLIIDGISICMIFGSIVVLMRGSRVEGWMVAVPFAAVSALALAVFGTAALGDAIIAIRNLLLYVSGGIFAAVTLKTRDDAYAVIRTIMGTGLAISIFGCIQFVLRTALPTWLLYSSDTKLFGYWGTDITRSTGLVGNSIVYGTLTLLTFMLWAAASFRPSLTARSRLWHLVATAVSAFAVIVSFSRFSIAAMSIGFLAITIIALWRIAPSRAIPLIFTIGLLTSIAILTAALNADFQRTIADSFIVKGLFGGSNESVAGSTEDHGLFTQLALESFKNNPWTGIGLGTQSGTSSAVVITDGFHLQTLVEGGLILTAVMALTYVTAFTRILTAWRTLRGADSWLPVALALFFASQIFIAGFYNTGFYGKVPNVVFWVAFGALVALARAANTDRRPSSIASKIGQRPHLETAQAVSFSESYE